MHICSTIVSASIGTSDGHCKRIYRLLDLSLVAKCIPVFASASEILLARSNLILELLVHLLHFFSSLASRTLGNSGYVFAVANDQVSLLAYMGWTDA